MNVIVVIQAGVTEEGVQVVNEVKAKKLNIWILLTEEEYLDILDNLTCWTISIVDLMTDPNKFIAKMGGEAVHGLLSRIRFDLLYQVNYVTKHHTETSQQRKSEALKRLSVVEAFREANKHVENRPEWMVVQYLPVIPPELRPLVPLDGGRFASSDLNDLYRRVIIRNNRLKRLIEIKAPEVILRNEKECFKKR
jgi:DNA-directed RNA polymerase subunit beta'